MFKNTTATAVAGLDVMPSTVQSDQSSQPLTQRQPEAYYTPSVLASLLAKWAILSSNEYVLEPGFGGCGFFQAAVDRLSKLGSSPPKNQLYGCDIDPQAFAYLSENLGVLSIEHRYILSDFIAVSPQSFFPKLEIWWRG